MAAELTDLETTFQPGALSFSSIQTVYKSHPSLSKDIAIFELEDASAPKRRQNRLTSHFLRLPPEVRVQIYGYLLIRKRRLHMVHWAKGTLDTNFAAIIQVNHEIAEEAASVLYRNNSFQFVHNPPPRVRPFLDSQTQCPDVDIPSRFISSLRDVVIFSRISQPLKPEIHDKVAAIMDFLATSAPQLESLTLLPQTPILLSPHWYRQLLTTDFFITNSPIRKAVKRITSLRRFNVEVRIYLELEFPEEIIFTTALKLVKELTSEDMTEALEDPNVEKLLNPAWARGVTLRLAFGIVQ